MNDTEKEHQKVLARRGVVTTRESMSITQNVNYRTIDVNWFRTNHINLTDIEIDHFRRLLNYRRKRNRYQENYIQRSTMRQR